MIAGQRSLVRNLRGILRLVNRKLFRDFRAADLLRLGNRNNYLIITGICRLSSLRKLLILTGLRVLLLIFNSSLGALGNIRGGNIRRLSVVSLIVRRNLGRVLFLVDYLHLDFHRIRFLVIRVIKRLYDHGNLRIRGNIVTDRDNAGLRINRNSGDFLGKRVFQFHIVVDTVGIDILRDVDLMIAHHLGALPVIDKENLALRLLNRKLVFRCAALVLFGLGDNHANDILSGLRRNFGRVILVNVRIGL